MSFDEAFKSVLIGSNVKLSLKLNHLVIKKDESETKLFLKDINLIILETHQINLNSALLNALVKHKIILLTCDESHQINGIFTPFLGHFLSAKIAKEQMAVSVQRKAILWQKIIKNKIKNQAYVLKFSKHQKQSEELLEFSKRVLLGDSKNVEANAAALYFKTLFGKNFYREELCFVNSALNYGYAVIRACIIRSVCISGLLTWQGIKHDNIYNNFNLCDDLIEVFRPWVDLCVLALLKNKQNDNEFITKENKRMLIENLQSKVKIDGKIYPLNRAINHYTQNFKNALLDNQELMLVEFDD
ncbi:type II CRISPR-associated endonuclease Cas1 [Campylobacter cuniculorum]|uniref:CRISPR-associated endonuclease Cas1 n=2 Tax=Campylobacter cuniculorum TaxID=374106 RepID=A0A1W6BV98_9BACT|nr:type II CRISPR-associated endonuclease Cas1 [Campylobacter cuniculorum]ARJ56012.1 CRISPR/Cas system-associated endonuclease Cas1, type II-C [Campylobacter cuniculorum DSM 23162 = LMG 24588]QOR05233.1 type II CRISPR-associated endonuclease Cas1 [Campylobacter cuniculorum]